MKAFLSCLLMVATLTACKAERPAESATPTADPAAVDQPAADVPPATAPAPVTPPAAGPMPAPGAITFAGFGPASFGASDEEVRMAWGKNLGDGYAGEPGGCYYLFPQPRPESGYRLGFMIEGDKFVRIDVDTVGIVAPGGGTVGMSAEEIGTLYAGRIEERPHKYVEGGKYLRIKDPDGGPGALVFNVVDGSVTAWRIGVPPQVDYVEGCA